MRAVFQEAFGGPEVLQVGELPDPPVGPDVVLVRVRAAGVNPVDYLVREGYPQGLFPWAFPLIPGWDVAGVVEQVGPAVPEFSPGDEVIGYARKDHVQFGTYAELVAVTPRHLARKPASVGFEQAAGLPLAGLTAYQALGLVGAGAGDVVLVHAAAGGVGSFAVQLAAVRGARVIGTASEANHDYLRSLGAEPVTYGDGLVERVRTLAPEGVDVAVDLVGGPTLEASRALVKEASRIVSVVDPTVLELGGRFWYVRPDSAMLGTLSDLVDDGRLRIEVARTFPLEQAAQAQQLVAERHVRGKVVLTV
jgi:NADPH:quinone reductase-like Zn-dependent oxidoreductase